MSSYDLAAIESEIKDGGYTRVAIQSVDVAAATYLCTELSRRFRSDTPEKEFYVLGDVFIGSCCTDIVAAKRCEAGYVLHVGSSCQSALAPSMPIRMVFERERTPESIIASNIRQALDERTFSKVVIIYDSCFHHLRDLFTDLLSNTGKDAYIAECRDKATPESDPNPVEQEEFCGRAVYSILDSGTKIPAAIGSLCLGDMNTLVLYINQGAYQGSTTYRIAISSSGSQMHLLSVTNGEVQHHNEDNLGDKLRLRRYRNVEKVRSADTIGVLVISRSLRSASNMRSSLAKLIEKHGKRSYTFSVNCLTEAKLANFPNVDVYCLLSCGEAILSLPDELARRTVAPFELLVALECLDWSMTYEFEFSRLLQYVTVTEEEQEEQTRNQEIRKLQGNCEITVQVESFMNSLPDNSKRTFGGVDPLHGISDNPTIVQGYHGTASGYTHEKRL